MNGMAQFWVLCLLSFRNLFSHKLKSTIVGSIMIFGTFLVVLGTALLDSVERSMAKSITASIAGHIQVYSAEAKDDLALFGGGFMGGEDVGRIDRFEEVRKALSKVDNVKAVVPMGIAMASVTSVGELERALGAMRIALRENKLKPLPGLKVQVREIAEQMKVELNNSAAIAKERDKIDKGLALLDRVTKDEFWTGFDENPLEALEFLDTKIAPLTQDGKLIYFRYVGTDVALFEKNFDRFELVKGEKIPPNKRGFLFNDKFYEDWVKNYVARGLDKIHREVTEKHKSIAGDPTLQAKVRQISRQYKRITYQLDPQESKRLQEELQKELGKEAELNALLQEFLTVTDQNLEQRYKTFYALIAPMIDLYQIDVGETLTLRSYTQSGFLKAVNLKLYGTFKFKGLERSDLAGGHSLMDIMSFRELYGLMSDARKAELKSIQKEVGLKEVSRDSAEDALFGEETELTQADAGDGFNEFDGVDLVTERDRLAALQSASFTQKQIDEGLALNAAVVLKDPTKLEQSMTDIEEAFKAAGMKMNVVDWQSAAGLVGQFIVVIRWILYLAIVIIFLVALVIINNSMVMATMERVTEIGTMRAIGAQKRMVLLMFLLETLVLGVSSGLVGVGLGAGLVTLFGSVGIPAPADFFVFMFSGPALYPTVGMSNIVKGLVAILGVSVVSTMYPAYVAAQIQPIMAMRAKE